MKAVIELDVPEWQIGQDVSVYFPDTMVKHGKCELLKEQEAKEQCLKTKCTICPHCSNCDVDENGLLKEQEAVEPFHKCIDKDFTLIEDSHFDYCPYCGKPITWAKQEGR